MQPRENGVIEQIMPFFFVAAPKISPRNFDHGKYWLRK
jgi:hypothetical protein